MKINERAEKEMRLRVSELAKDGIFLSDEVIRENTQKLIEYFTILESPEVAPWIH